MMQVTINYVAVFVAAIVSMVVGFLWYGPLFGKMWMKMSGVTQKQIEEAKKKGMTTSYVVAFVGSLVMAYILAHFVRYVGATTAAAGMQLAFWLWLGFIVTVKLGSVLWENKPMQLFFLDCAYYLVTLSIMSSILAVW